MPAGRRRRGVRGMRALGELWESFLHFISSGQGKWLGEWVFNKEMAQESIAALVVFALGWLASARGSRKRQKKRIVDELILSQRELVGRAYPELRGGKWQQMGEREAWMLDPFVARIRFLIGSLDDEGSLTLRELDALERYISTVEDFIVKWARTHNRTQAYHSIYEVSYRALVQAVRELGLNQTRRLAGLLPKDPFLDNGNAGSPGGSPSATTNQNVTAAGTIPAPAE